MSEQTSFVYDYNDVDCSLSSINGTPLVQTNAAINDVFFENVDVESSNEDEEENKEEDTPLPDWINLNITEIYNQLNPYTQEAKINQREWRKRAIDSNGRALHSVGLLANRLLKLLVAKDVIPNTPLNIKLQTKKADRLFQLHHFQTMVVNDESNLTFVRQYLCSNIHIPINTEGDAIPPKNIDINLTARIIMLAVDPEPFSLLEYKTNSTW
jgi:hypothetical protein